MFNKLIGTIRIPGDTSVAKPSYESTPALRRCKEILEAKTGLQFADSLNVVLFLLSFVSLVVALGAAYLAWATLKDARESSVTQQQVTKDVQAALNQSVTNLQTVNGQLLKQKDILDQALVAAQQEDELLRISTGAAKQTVETLEKIKEQPNQTALLATGLDCRADIVGLQQDKIHRRSGDLVGYETKQRLHAEKESHNGFMSFHEGIKYDCFLYAKNLGQRRLDEYAVSISGRSDQNYTIQYQLDDNRNAAWTDLPHDKEALKILSGTSLLPFSKEAGKGDSGTGRSIRLRFLAPPGTPQRNRSFDQATIWLNLSGSGLDESTAFIIVDIFSEDIP